MNKLQKSIYLFSQDYTKIDGSAHKAIVRLIVDYQDNTFEVEPYNTDGFKFKYSRNSESKWLAVTEAIKEAIDFGNQEVGYTNKPIRERV
jgi:hypothetical protein